MCVRSADMFYDPADGVMISRMFGNESGWAHAGQRARGGEEEEEDGGFVLRRRQNTGQLIIDT